MDCFCQRNTLESVASAIRDLVKTISLGINMNQLYMWHPHASFILLCSLGGKLTRLLPIDYLNLCLAGLGDMWLMKASITSHPHRGQASDNGLANQPLVEQHFIYIYIYVYIHAHGSLTLPFPKFLQAPRVCSHQNLNFSFNHSPQPSQPVVLQPHPTAGYDGCRCLQCKDLGKRRSKASQRHNSPGYWAVPAILDHRHRN